MRKLISITMLFALMPLMACTHKPDASSDKPMSVKDTVFGDDVRALDKAKGVQNTLNQDKANTDKAIEAATDDKKLPVSTD